jgi:thymidylate synthase
MYTDVGEVNDIYPDAINEVMSRGAEVTPRGKRTLEIHPALIEITDPTKRLVTSFGRPVNVAFALAEVLWILGGRRDVGMLEPYNSNIATFSDNGEYFNAAYGYRLRTEHGHDQLMDAIATLRTDPDTRQAVVLMWHPERDKGFENARTAYEDTRPIGYVPAEGEILLNTVEPHVTKDRACNVLAHLLIRNGRLDWTQFIRSNDALWGTPYNWMQWMHLQEYVAAQVGVPVGSFFHFANSFHIYEPQWQEAQMIEGFDLYRHLQAQHLPCGELSIETINLLMREEHLLRINPDATKAVLHDTENVPDYWLAALQIMMAHHLYRQGHDLLALQLLSQAADLDPVLAVAQMRFYYYWRWHKPEYEQIVKLLNTHMADNDGVLAWITDAAFVAA